MKLLNRAFSSLSNRRRWARLGVYKLRSDFFLDSVRVAGNRIRLAYPDWDMQRAQAECQHLYWDDPYGLAAMPSTLQTVLDIGANMGFFSVLARQYFPKAAIHAYEPNPQLAPFLEKNTAALNVTLHHEGLGRGVGQGSLRANGNSLTTSTDESNGGPIPLVPLCTAVRRIGGSVDLLKMDCEGAEWLTLDDRAGWRAVKYLSAEYHLGTDAGRTLDELVKRLNDLGFDITSLRQSSNPAVGLIRAENKTSCTL